MLAFCDDGNGAVAAGSSLSLGMIGFVEVVLDFACEPFCEFESSSEGEEFEIK